VDRGLAADRAACSATRRQFFGHGLNIGTIRPDATQPALAICRGFAWAAAASPLWRCSRWFGEVASLGRLKHGVASGRRGRARSAVATCPGRLRCEAATHLNGRS
jgi:hypothetical protein